jgi:hypothetical protein
VLLLDLWLVLNQPWYAAIIDPLRARVKDNPMRHREERGRLEERPFSKGFEKAKRSYATVSTDLFAGRS